MGFLQEQIRCINSGQLSPALIETIKVGSVPLNHIAYTLIIKGGIVVHPYEPDDASKIVKSVQAAGFNSYLYAKGVVMVSVPPITLEEKQKTFRHLDKLAEDAKIAVRAMRQKYRNGLTKAEQKEQDKSIQIATDAAIKQVDCLIESKKAQL